MSKQLSPEELSKKDIEIIEFKPCRYHIVEKGTNKILDNANGYGYKSIYNAQKAWRYKTYVPTKEQIELREKMKQWWNKHKECSNFIDEMIFETTVKDREDFTEKDTLHYTKQWMKNTNVELPEGVSIWQLVHYRYKFTE